MTKADLAQVKADLQHEIAELRGELRQEIAELKGELRQEIAELKGGLRQEIAESKADILKWMFGMIAGAVVINVMTIIGAMLALVRLLGH